MHFKIKSTALVVFLFLCVQQAFSIYLYSHYNGSSLNSSIGGYTGITNGASSPFGPGRCGTSFKFDGIDDYITTQIPAIGTEDFSLSAWIQTEDEDAGVMDSYYGTGFQVRIYQGKLRITVRGSGSTMSKTINSNKYVSDGKWHHILLSFDRDSSNGLKVYVDGELDVSGNISGQTGAINFTTMTIGSVYYWPAPNRPYIRGMVDNIKLFKGVETPGSIMDYEDCPLDPVDNVRDWFDGQTFKNMGREGLAQSIYEADPYNNVSIGDGQCTDGYHFDGTDGVGDYMLAPHVLPAHGEGDFTLSLWVKVNEDYIGGTNSYHGQVMHLLDKNDAFSLYVDADSTIAFRLYAPEPGNYSSIKINSSMKVTSKLNPDLKWFHVMVSVDRDEPEEGIKLYIDGILAGTGDPTNQQGDVGKGDMTIGTPYNFRIVRATGAMDEIKIYTTALKPSEVNRTEPCPSINLADLDCGQKNDFIILEDATYSFDQHINNINSQIMGFSRKLIAADGDAQIGIATFKDRPYGYYGGHNFGNYSFPSDYEYKLEQVLTNDEANLSNALGQINVGGGGSALEGVLDALFYASKRIAEMGVRSNSKRTILLTTDHEFHKPGYCVDEVGVCNKPNDGDAYLDYPNCYRDYDCEGLPSYAQLAQALTDANIKPAFYVPQDKFSYYSELLNELGVYGVQGTLHELKGQSEDFHEVAFDAMGCTVIP